MGRWFPDYRTATPEQARTYREAHKDLWRQGDHERAAGLPRDFTAVSERLNSRAYDTRAPLSRTQQAWHFQRALHEYGREQDRLQRASDRQDRQLRRTGRSR